MFEAVNYFDVSYGSENVIMYVCVCVLAEILSFSFLFLSYHHDGEYSLLLLRQMKSCRLVM